MTVSFSKEPTLSHEPSERSVIERAQQLQQEQIVSKAEVGELMGTMRYALAMTSEHSNLSPEARRVLNEANALELRCRGIRLEIKKLFEA
jgi:hypothetical protein